MSLESNGRHFSSAVGRSSQIYMHTNTRRSTEVRSGVFMMCDLISWLLKRVDNTQGWTLESERRQGGRHRETHSGVWKSIVSAFYHSWVAGGSKVNPILLSATVTLPYWHSYLKQHWLNQPSANAAEALKRLMEPPEQRGIQTNGFIEHSAHSTASSTNFTLGFYTVVCMNRFECMNSHMLWRFSQYARNNRFFFKKRLCQRVGWSTTPRITYTWYLIPRANYQLFMLTC